jgi:hypothetical protein
MVLLVACGFTLLTAGVAVASSATTEQAFCGTPTLPVGDAPLPFKARLGIDRKTVAPGGKLRVRVENLGDEAITYGYAYRLARLKQGAWINQPTRPVFGAKSFARAGHAGPCQEIRIAGDAAAGTYRIAKKVSPAESEQSKSVVVRVTFKVH